MNTAASRTALLHDALTQALGPSALINKANTTLYTTDVYSAGAAPGLVVRPATQEQVADAVRISTQAGWAITQRGGGMSYTGGYRPQQSEAVMLDLSALNPIVSIDEDDLVITV